jgi:hypothetical protein
MIPSRAAISTGEIILLCVRCYLRFIGLPKVLARICAKAGLEGVTVHAPRHSFAAVWASRGHGAL